MDASGSGCRCFSGGFAGAGRVLVSGCPAVSGSKVSEVIEAAETIEPAVKRGVREGVEETLREFPETSLKESTRQVRKFGSGLFENGLSSFWADGPGSTRKKADD